MHWESTRVYTPMQTACLITCLCRQRQTTLTFRLFLFSTGNTPVCKLWTESIDVNTFLWLTLRKDFAAGHPGRGGRIISGEGQKCIGGPNAFAAPEGGGPSSVWREIETTHGLWWWGLGAPSLILRMRSQFTRDNENQAWKAYPQISREAGIAFLFVFKPCFVSHPAIVLVIVVAPPNWSMDSHATSTLLNALVIYAYLQVITSD